MSNIPVGKAISPVAPCSVVFPPVYRTFIPFPYVHFIAIILESCFMMDIFFMYPGFTFEGIIIIFFHENGFDGSINSEYVLWYERHLICLLIDSVLSPSFFTNHSW